MELRFYGKLAHVRGESGVELQPHPNGVVRPVFYKGEQVGEWRHFDERLTMFLLRFRRRHRFGPEAERPILLSASRPGEQEEIPVDPEMELAR